MKLINKIFLLGALIGLVAFIGCSEDDLIKPTPSPEIPAGNQGVYFPASNKSAFEILTEDPAEIEITIARNASEGAVDVPITQEVNDDNVFNVPASVTFAAGETEATFKVTFPDAVVDKAYNLKLNVSGDQYVNPYVEGVPYVATKVTVSEPEDWVWETLAEPMVFVDGLFSDVFEYAEPQAFYVEAEKGTLGDVVRYRFKNVYNRLSDADAPDEDGIWEVYDFTNTPDLADPTNESYTIIQIGGTADGETIASNEVVMFPFDSGIPQLFDYGQLSIGSIFPFYESPEKENTKENYPLGSIENGIITFEGNLFFTMSEYGTFFTESLTKIYFTKAIYDADNKSIKDFNDLEYEVIEGEESAFASKAFDDSWSQPLAKAVDIDEENPESAFKNLFFLSDLYSKGKGVAFYYDKESGDVTIPENQPIGVTVFGQDLYVSASETIESSVEDKENGLTEYTLGMIFHYEDGTIVGDFSENLFYSEDAISFVIDDFTGDFLMSGFTPFDGRDDAEEIPIKIALGENDNELVITGIRYAEEIIATFDPLTSMISIAPQPLADAKFNNDMINASLITWIIDGNNLEPSTTAIIELETNLLGDISLSAYSEAIGYGIETTDLGGGFLDGYYYIDFIRAKSANAASLNSFDTSVSKIQSNNSIVRSIQSKKEKGNNFKVQGKKSTRQMKKLKNNGQRVFIFR